MKMQKALSLFVLAFMLFACNKEKAPELGSQPNNRGQVRIDIESPLDGASISSMEDTVIQVFLWDELSLHEFTVEVTDTEGKRYFYEEGHTHFPEKRFSWPWKNTAPKGTQLFLTVKASNHLNILSTKTIQFQSDN